MVSAVFTPFSPAVQILFKIPDTNIPQNIGNLSLELRVAASKFVPQSES